jgi:hypothetical protein
LVLVFSFTEVGFEELLLFSSLSLDLFECVLTLVPISVPSFFIGSSPSLFFISCSLTAQILGVDLGDFVLIVASTEESKRFWGSSLSVVLPFFLSSDDGFFGASTSAFPCFGEESFVRKKNNLKTNYTAIMHMKVCDIYLLFVCSCYHLCRLLNCVFLYRLVLTFRFR